MRLLSFSGPLIRESTQATLWTTTPPSTQPRPPRFRRDLTSTPPATQPRPPGLQQDPTSTPPSTQASLRPPCFRGHDDSGSTYRDHEGNSDRQSPVDQSDDQDIKASQVAGAKRYIAMLEDELEKLHSGLKCKIESNGDCYINQGRAIQCLVSLFESINNIVGEQDRRAMLDDDESSIEQSILPMKTIKLSDPKFTTKDQNALFQKLRKGADGAQGDDVGNLKSIIVSWIAEIFSVADLTLDASDKSSCGFANDHTGHLLCPIEYDWSDSKVKTGIHDHNPDFLVTALMMPTFLYENYKMNADDMEEGLFKSTLLLKTFKFIFTSPSSARGMVENDSYVSMPTTGQSHPIDGDFDYKEFYRFIADFLEMPPGPASKNRVNVLLLWWNRKVFGPHNASNYSPQDYARMLVSKLEAQRVAQESILLI
ncbi:hypothetical protein SERLADRAFT_439322 [Serpula lacrymans var. lacrymans S7.9]|uniref:Uncharacterized protein n=1 Tax=Serpula lacrymans var. lacrymans (strain S7.9) TaxID=578457 RepID=F8NZJ6_SERL9|nr:uncharacterized protein SERLADRAFT_439322 [Serpula lacrymans var. lacrymans S7.9]EGO24016.1 hypothetical protein SERLADRAFT_439322 [Serpula lacrymans var. lacrymans S7.9]